MVSAFAIIGTMFTFESSFFMQTRSIDFKLKNKSLQNLISYCLNNLVYYVENLPMSSWTNEIQADMNAAIMVSWQRALDFQFLLQVGFELWVDVINDGFEAVFFIYLVTIANSVHDGQF